MSNVMHVSGQFEPEFVRDPVVRPMLVAVLFHILLFAGGLGFAYLEGLFPHTNWGGNNDGGAIAVQLVSNALPLPADRPPNDNVLATEKPSEAPAPPAPKAKATGDESAIPIPAKIEPPKKAADKKQEVSKPTKPVIPPPITRTPSRAQTNPQDNRARYGEQSSNSMPRSTQASPSSSNGPATVTSGDFGNRFPWYVAAMNRKMTENWYQQEVDQRTPAGTRVFIQFTIRRDGSVTDVQLDRSSGSPTLDRSCIRAAQRVDTFGQLPAEYAQSTVRVSYYCDYTAGTSR